jgi:hypothetical protein
MKHGGTEQSDWIATKSAKRHKKTVGREARSARPSPVLPMHTSKTASETLEFLWDNHCRLSEEIDPDWMPHDTLIAHAQQKSPLRPFRIASWVARLGFFISAWSLWEYYARSVCERLDVQERRSNRESTVQWVGRSFRANGVSFTDQDWFESANSLRNLIAHNGARVDGDPARNRFDRSRRAFPTIYAYPDGYVGVSHSDVADLCCKIEDFISQTNESTSQFSEAE